MTEEKHIFKVGDRVRVIDDFHPDVCKGDLGTIIYLKHSSCNKNNWIWIVFDNDLLNGPRRFRSERIELVKETTEKTHYINGVSVSNNIYTLCFGSEEDPEKNIEIVLPLEEMDNLLCAIFEIGVPKCLNNSDEEN